MKIEITEAFLKKYSSNQNNSAWSKSFLLSIGVKFPLVQGWKQKIIGTWIDDKSLPAVRSEKQLLTIDNFLQ